MSEIQRVTVEAGELAPVIEVLSLAFRDYPVMRHVVASDGERYERDLRRLVRLFVETRAVRGGVVWAFCDGSETVAAACIDRPTGGGGGTPETQAELDELRAEAWGDLGSAARARYEDYGVVSERFVWPERRWHLGMIGVHPERRGEGLARPILEALHARAAEDGLGCSLTTELRANLPFYEHFGYVVVGHGEHGGLEGWGLYREPTGEGGTGEQ